MVGIFGHQAMGGFEGFESIRAQVTTQLTAASVTAVYAIVASVVLLLLIKYTIGLRISEILRKPKASTWQSTLSVATTFRLS